MKIKYEILKEGILDYYKNSKLSDPVIIDTTGNLDKNAKELLKRDYVSLKELVIIDGKIKSVIKGLMRFKVYLKKATDFERDLVIICSNLKHKKLLRSILNGTN